MGFLRCPRCGAENREESRFCAQCGTPLTAANLRHYPSALDITPDDYNAWEKERRTTTRQVGETGAVSGQREASGPPPL